MYGWVLIREVICIGLLGKICAGTFGLICGGPLGLVVGVAIATGADDGWSMGDDYEDEGGL
tara:strand:+ start:718 stop:900 length:183 start_codon:yes stop_codon:yes gene_type:complete